jgi:hypothetical protein
MDPSKPIASITRDQNGMFSNSAITTKYSVESLSKGLPKKHKNQSNDYLKSLERMDNVLLVPKARSQSASESNAPLKFIHRDSSGMFVNKTPVEPSPPEIETNVPLSRSSSRSFGSSHNISARLSRRESRLVQSEDSIDRAGFKFNSSDSFLPDWSDPALLESKANSESQLPKTINSISTVEASRKSLESDIQDQIDEKLSGFVTDVSIARPSSRNSTGSRVSFQLPSANDPLNSKEGINEILKPPMIPRSSVSNSSRASRSPSLSSGKPPEVQQAEHSSEKLFTVLKVNEDSMKSPSHADIETTEPSDILSPQLPNSIIMNSQPVDEKLIPATDMDSSALKSPSRKSSLRRMSRRPSTHQNDKDVTVESVSHLNLATINSGTIPNVSNQEEQSPIAASPRKKKSTKKKVAKENGADEIENEKISDSAKKKKMRKQRKEKELHQLKEHLDNLTQDASLTPQSDDVIPPKPQKDKKRRKRESGMKENDTVPFQEPVQPPVLKTPVEILFESLGHDAEYYQDSTISVTIEKADSLQSSLHLKHPFVQIHIVDTSTGQYLLKTDSLRQVTYFNEPSSINYILPTVTRDYDLKAHTTKIPQWNDTILLNEHYLHLLQPTTLVLFEILDVYTSMKQVQK